MGRGIAMTVLRGVSLESTTFESTRTGDRLRAAVYMVWCTYVACPTSPSALLLFPPIRKSPGGSCPT
eukprot:9561148-Prorocentrum_lima.AAC.1